VWGKVDTPPIWLGRYEPYESRYSLNNPYYPYYILDYEPEFMPISERLEIAAQRIVELPHLYFSSDRQ
jgi:hypothetical protein